MPFAKDTTELLGRVISVQPQSGFGWRLTEHNRLLQELDQVPGEFQGEVVDVLFNGAEAQALVCQLDLFLAGRRFCWGYFGPRTESTIDLRNRQVGCNILLSDTKPYLSQAVKYPAPDQVCTESPTQLRGQGRVSLLEPK